MAVPGSEGHAVRKQASFADVHGGSFMAGDKTVPIEIGLIANGDSACAADPELKAVQCAVVGNLHNIVVTGEMKSAVLYPGSLSNGQSIVFSFIPDGGFYWNDAFPNKLQPVAPMDPIEHQKSRQRRKSSYHGGTPLYFQICEQNNAVRREAPIDSFFSGKGVRQNRPY
jgi:hypothetical protein